MATVERKRGGCLTAYLIVMLIALALGVISYIVAGSTVRQYSPYLPDWAIPVMTLGGIANFVFALAIWNWKKWGVYGYVAVGLVAFLVNFVSGIPILSALLGLVGLAILIFLVRPPLWHQME